MGRRRPQKEETLTAVRDETSPAELIVSQEPRSNPFTQGRAVPRCQNQRSIVWIED